MKHSEAVKLLQEALWCVQHLRSINTEQDEEIPGLKRAAELLMPYVFDDEQTVLKPLLLLTERVANGGKVSGMEFYNMMFIIWRWGEIVNIKLQISTGDPTNKFPEPDVKWCLGLEDG